MGAGTSVRLDSKNTCDTTEVPQKFREEAPMPNTIAQASADSKFVLGFVMDTCKPLEAVHELAPGVLAVTNRHNLEHVYFDLAKWESSWGMTLTRATPDGIIGLFSIPEGAYKVEYAKNRLRPRNPWYNQPKKLEI